ncbi:MAG: hypothetical protein ONB11_08705, partial [candidate division KSB1 bacterium]|nr:hypothetical protein [candidate division KSB1 bacterium]
WLAVQFFNVPKKPIKIGEQWTETKLDTITHTDTTRQSSQISINKSQSTYTVLGEEMKMGFRCLHLLVETTRSLQSSEKAKDNETNSEGEGETKSEAWFAYNEGMLVAFDSSDFYEGTTAYSGSRNMTSANTTESKLSLRLIKYQPAHK